MSCQKLTEMDFLCSQFPVTLENENAEKEGKKDNKYKYKQ